VFGALQGALLVKRTTDDPSQRRHRGDEVAACRAPLSGGFGSISRQCPQKSGFIFK